MSLRSFEADGAAVIIGASGGIGGALSSLLRDDPSFTTLYPFARGFPSERRIDVTDEDSIAAAAAQVAEPLRLVIVATGALQGPGFSAARKELSRARSCGAGGELPRQHGRTPLWWPSIFFR